MSTANGKQRVSVVTGAGSGIGAATARLLAGQGDIVVCADRDVVSAAAVAAEIGGYPVDLDVADSDSCDHLVQLVLERDGRIDTLAHCAGIWLPGRAHETDLASFDRVIDVNLKGSFLIARAVAKSMIDQGLPGSIVLIGSVNSVRAGAGQLAYAASKGGVLMLGEVLALEWAEHHIRVNVVAPGLTATAMLAEGLAASPGAADPVLNRTPMRRAAEPVEIAETIEFLLSERSSFTTGSYVVVDGGWLVD